MPTPHPPARDARGRISTDGSTPFAAAAGRYELTVAAASPWAHRTSIGHALANLRDVVDLVTDDDASSDARPRLVDRVTGLVVTDDPRAINIDLA